MKPFVSIMIFVAAISAAIAPLQSSQAATFVGPAPAALRPSVNSPLAVPNAPGFRAPAVVPPAVGLSQNVSSLNTLLFSNPAFVLTNTAGLPIDYREYAAVLLDLQRSMQQALPVIAALNQNLSLNGFQSLLPGGLVQTPPVGGSVQPSASAGVGATAAGVIAARPLAGNANRPGALEPTGPANPTGAPVLATTPPGLVNNPASSVEAYRETFQALALLQSDLQRLLPVVAALNGNTNLLSTIGGNTVITNGPGALRAPAMAPGSEALAPTVSPGALTPDGQ